MSGPLRPAPPTRRPPPPFRVVTVLERAPVTPRLTRVTLGGSALVGFPVPEPAASVRVLLPTAATLGPDRDLILPTWAGNEFLLPDGSRPPIRTLTPRHVDPAAGTLAVEVVDHGIGLASAWAATTRPGGRAAVSGPGAGYRIDAAAPAFLLAGDETALPAIATLTEALRDRLDDRVPVEVHLELVDPEACPELIGPPGMAIHRHPARPGAPPGDALVDAVDAALRSGRLPAGVRVWAAGEAAAVQRLRRCCFERHAVPRAHASIRGYWKHGRAAGGGP